MPRNVRLYCSVYGCLNSSISKPEITLFGLPTQSASMHVTDLPEDILILIIKYLDTKSLHNLYYASQYMKNTITLTGAVKRCQMSMNTLATVNSFKTDFFKAIAPHLLELNLCGVPDLRKSYLVPAMKKLKCLRILDVSFTYIDIMDFLDIYEVCPTIKSVAINISKNGFPRIPHNFTMRYQDMFKNFQHVHFIGTNTNLLQGRLPYMFLKKAELETLKYSIIESDLILETFDDVVDVVLETFGGDAKFKHFSLCFVARMTFTLPVLSTQDINNIEAFFLVKHNSHQYLLLEATPIFQNYFQKIFGVDRDIILVTDNDCYKNDGITGNAIIMIWKKEAYEFNDNFFEKLTKLMKPIFSCDCQPLKGLSVPHKCDQLYLTVDPANIAENDYVKPPKPSDLKRRRLAPPMNVLKFDELLKSKEKVELFLTFNGFLKNPVSLPSNCDYLKKLTFLSMTGAVRLSLAFFNVLFKSCVNLVTVNIESPPMSPCTLPVSRAIHLSPRLKNFRLTDRKIDFESLFCSLAKCRTLENVCVVELSSGENVDIGDPSLVIEQCPNLYNLFIQAPMSESKRKKKSQVLHNTKMRQHKHHLNLVLHMKSDREYDPFLSVFNSNPISQIL